MSSSHLSGTEEERLLEETQDASDELTQPETRKLYGVLLIIIVLQFFTRAADTIIYVFYPVRATDKGLSMTEVGIVFSAYDFSRFISSPVFGSLLLRWPPKSMCAVGTLVLGFACAAFGTIERVDSREWFLGLCIVIRVIAGIGSIMITIASTSILLKVSRLSAGTIIGISETVSGFAFTIGPAVGAALYGMVGYAVVFWIFGGALTISIPIFLFLVPSVVEEANTEKKNFFDLIKIPGCLLMFAVCVLIRINAASRNVGLSEYLSSELPQSVLMVGVVYAVSSIVYVVSCVLNTRIVNKFKGWKFQLLMFGWLFLAAVLMFLGPSPLLEFIFRGKKYFWLAFVAMIGMNIAAGSIFIPPFPAALDLADVNGHPKDSLHTYGMVTGLVNSGWSLGATTGPIIAGAIMDALNFDWTMTCLAFADVAMALLIVTYLLYMRLTNQPIAPSADPSTNEMPTVPADIMRQRVADACHDRMDTCLKNSGELTKIHHQQPVDELNK